MDMVVVSDGKHHSSDWPHPPISASKFTKFKNQILILQAEQLHLYINHKTTSSRNYLKQC